MAHQHTCSVDNLTDKKFDLIFFPVSTDLTRVQKDALEKSHVL